MDKRKIIKELSLAYTKGNDAEFARKLGITPQVLSNWKSRGSIDYELVYTKCENVNASFLLSGVGSVIETSENYGGSQSRADEECAHCADRRKLIDALEKTILAQEESLEFYRKQDFKKRTGRSAV